MRLRSASGSSCSPRVVEPATSANRIVTSLRDSDRSAGAVTRRVRHSPQNWVPSGFSRRQAGQGMGIARIVRGPRPPRAPTASTMALPERRSGSARMRRRVAAPSLGGITDGCHRLPRSIDMTTWPPQPLPPTQHHSPLAVVFAALVGGTVVFTLIVTAVTFAALTLAFPLAEQLQPWISPRDYAIAQQVADFWWAFAGFAFAS